MSYTLVSLRLIVACLTVAACLQAAGAAEFGIGSPAPTLDVEHWIQDREGAFEPVTRFSPGRVYVVEFWATWCGPCIASMPHLAKLQDSYADKGVTVISVSDEEPDTVRTFLDGETGEGKQTYADVTKKYCLTTDPDGSVKKDYMEAAGQNGIPTAFIVGKTGEIEWIGHPMEMDEPLEQVVVGSWNRQAFLEEKKEIDALEKRFAEINGLLQGDDPRQAVRLIDDLLAASTSPKIKMRLEGIRGRVESMANQMIARKALEAGGPAAMKAFARLVAAAGESADRLNEAAWLVVELEATGTKPSADLLAAATASAQKAVTLEPQNPAALDTLAHLQAARGDLDEAVATQRKAVEHAGSGRMKRQISGYLEELEAKAAK